VVAASPGRLPDPEPQKNPEPGLRPLPGKEKLAPNLTKKTRLTMTTSAGTVVLEVYPQAAPNAAKRFMKLAKSGFFDDTPVCRVVDGFAAQFGVNWRAPHNKWRVKTFKDDPPLFCLDRGTMAFVRTDRNKGATQVMINLRDNSQLAAPDRSFAAFGKVVEGMEIVDRFAQVGDPSQGLDQGLLWNDGGSYLHSLVDKPTMIESLVVNSESPKVSHSKANTSDGAKPAR
jgi:cyclophilin family peptidyl-prolyl cis-trans isomerase